MTKFTIIFSKKAKADILLLSKKEKLKLKEILSDVICIHPYIGKKLLGALKGNYSYRRTIKDRIVYSVMEKEEIVFVKRVRSHYGE